MQYQFMQRGTFLKRPNRFLAQVLIDGKEELCHVKNTGRCKELLVEGASVWVQKHPETQKRKTKFSLIAVQKGSLLINMDSQAPNEAAAEWLPKSGLFPDLKFIKREAVYGGSRFDFYLETEQKRCFVEVKGVTLEESGIAKFPDAPTERGARHVRELCACMDDGYEAYLLFVIQMQPVRCFTPNVQRDPAFAKALSDAKMRGVHLLAMDCRVTENSMELDREVSVILEGKDYESG